MDVTRVANLAASLTPQGVGPVPLSPDTLLLIDGDGLAYYCAGGDDTPPDGARQRLYEKIASAQRATGALSVKILLTASGSMKGDRYAISRVKPYQGHRAGSKRPKNWGLLRDVLERRSVLETSSLPGPARFKVESTATAEADDLFAKYAYAAPDNVVIYTQDKDMRMLPGWHLIWDTHALFKVNPGESPVHDGKQYGVRWFWLQMLQGDTADNIPGLPYYRDVFDKLKRVGPVTAEAILDSDLPYDEAVRRAYASYYGERALEEMLEQACLLWLRKDPDYWFDCLDKGGPLFNLISGQDPISADAAYHEIEKRVEDARQYNTPQDDTGSTVPQ